MRNDRGNIDTSSNIDYSSINETLSISTEIIKNLKFNIEQNDLVKQGLLRVKRKISALKKKLTVHNIHTIIYIQ